MRRDLQPRQVLALRARRVAVLAAWAAVLSPPALSAQTDVEALGRLRGGATPPAGYYRTLRQKPNAFQFSTENGWVQRGQAVSASRVRQRAAGAGRAAAAPQRANVSAGGVLRGTLTVPVFLVMYANTPPLDTANLPRDSIARRLYGTQAAPPYSIHSYYREISNDSLIVNGVVLDWRSVSKADTAYEGKANGLDNTGDVAGLIREIVVLHDAAVDYRLFDNDGPDGIPNSGDDDGYVDALVLLHPEVGGECRAVNAVAQKNIWAHRYTYAGWTGMDLLTADDAVGGGKIKIRDYIIQGGQGGDGVPAGRGGCESDKPQAMGVVAHETGHLFGLPDLYDTIGSTSGIGWWGLMGAGNQKVAWRPAHMEAWSRAELGWITEVRIERDTVLDISPIALSDTAYVFPVCSSNEYYLVENRQAIGSDSMLAGFGLLVWHVDSALIAQRRFANSVNGAKPYGLSLVEADGVGQLQTGANRGDAGDPYPGSSAKTRFSFDTSPSNARHDGMPIELTFDAIEQLIVGGTMRMSVTFAAPALTVTSPPPPGGKAGVAYDHSFAAVGGVGQYRWSFAAGTVPAGLALDAAGRLAGTPEQGGSFTVDARVTSGCQTATQTATIDVTVPVLTVDAVVRHLVGAEALLTTDELAYLDIVGNKNGRFDVGDFLAWTQATGGAVTAQELGAVLAATAPGPGVAPRRSR